MHLNYRVSGPQDAPALVLSHSLGTNLTMWDRVLPILEQDFRIIRFDFRGHGGTPPTGTNCTVADLQDDVIALLDDLGIRRTHFAGLSLGGMVGLGLALDHPDRLHGLVVCDAGAQTSAASRSTWDARIAQLGAGGMSVLVEPTLERWFGDAFRSDAEAMNWMRAMILGTSADGYICCARAVQGFDVKRRLGEIGVPTLYLTGEQDQSAAPAMMQELQALTPGSQFLAIPGAGHISAVENPAAVGAAIAGFLTALPNMRD